jgi:hypothetical protein
VYQGGDRLCLLQKVLFTYIEETHVLLKRKHLCWRHDHIVHGISVRIELVFERNT